MCYSINMQKAYFLGGPPRIGKSTIMDGFITSRPVPLICADAVRGGLKNALFGEPHVSVRAIAFEGRASFKRPGNLNVAEVDFASTIGMNELALRAIAGMFEHYDRNYTEAATEGSIITPSWVKSLELSNLAVRAAFVGYSDVNQAEAILDYAQHCESDWINSKLKELGGDKHRMRDWASEQVAVSVEIAAEAQKCSYLYIDASSQPFTEYVQTVQNYLLGAET